jgi:transcriptional regulator NrdR family protein
MPVHHIAAPACPYCGAHDSAVQETKHRRDGTTRRRRRCRFCGLAFSTTEEAVLPEEGRKLTRKPPR